MRDSNNGPIHFLTIIEDISEQKAAEQSRVDAILHERTRIAQDIHDTLAQGFTGILIQLQAAAYAPEQEQARIHIGTASDLARQSLHEARRSVRALRPQALESGNLATALKQLVEQVGASSSMNVQFVAHGNPCFLPADIEDHLYRIGQEALTNAIKHSRAAEIKMDLWFEPTQVRLCIQDDGKGFDAKAGFQGNGFGLIGMSERAEQIGGRMSLASSPGHGTSICVTIDLEPGAPKEKPKQKGRIEE
jgi:signal transduction histidine kinase